MSETLKPCPFCNSATSQYCMPEEDIDNHGCGNEECILFIENGFKGCKTWAWNERPIEEGMQAKLEKLKRDFKNLRALATWSLEKQIKGLEEEITGLTSALTPKEPKGAKSQKTNTRKARGND